MSESYVPFLDSASATRKFRTNQRTAGSDTVEEYLSVESEPWLPAYAISAASTSLATANNHVIQIMAGASKRVHLRRLMVWQQANAAADAWFQFELRRLTTAGTGGSGLVAAPFDPADTTAGATAMIQPTVKGTEGVSLGRYAGFVDNAIATLGNGILLDLDWTKARTKGPVIAAGTSNGLALKQISNDASATAIVYAEIVESSVA